MIDKTEKTSSIALELARRASEHRADLARIPKGSPAFVGKVTTASPAALEFLMVNPVVLTGNEVEGGAATLIVDTSTSVSALLLRGPAVTGDLLLVRSERYRWVCERNAYGGGGTGITEPGCPCASTPLNIAMTSSAPGSNNQIFQSATLHYGPTPPGLLPIVLTPNSYISTVSFPDPLLACNFYYFLGCSFGSYVLTRVYLTSPFGSPFRDAIRYKWVAGFPGNACSPFSMTNGQIFSGGDPTCVVTLAAAP